MWFKFVSFFKPPNCQLFFKYYANVLQQSSEICPSVNIQQWRNISLCCQVIDHCKKRGRNTIPLRKAAKEGAGGGLGPVFPGKGGVRPSYMVADYTGVQMPNYQRNTTDETKHTIGVEGESNKRLGFVW